MKIPNSLTNTSTPTSAMLMEYSSLIEYNVVQESPHDMWYLYLGCNNHMAGNLNVFSNLDNSVQTNVRLGKNVRVMFFGKGIVGILTKQGKVYPSFLSCQRSETKFVEHWEVDTKRLESLHRR